MIKKIKINNDIISISPSDVLGIGGQATVVKSGNQAIKIYHQPNQLSVDKLQQLISSKLPINICSPQNIATDLKGNVVGFSMPLIPSGNEVVQKFASKKFRKLHPEYNSRFIAELFISAHRTVSFLHPKIIVGDFNDMNVMFRNDIMTFIDTDSFQIGKHPCPVGTEDFLPPELYNLDLSQKPYYKVEHDWYSYFVMLIRSLLMTHPYGGIHDDYKTTPQRALAKITVFDSTVRYPKPAFHPDILDTNIKDLFDKVFYKGDRLVFPIEVLEEYRDSLVECKSCKTLHPSERCSCPQCSTINTQQIQRRVNVIKLPGKRTVNCQEIFSTTGNFVWWKVLSPQIFAISLENGVYHLYKKKSLTANIEKVSLFSSKSDVKFDLFDKYLVVNTDPLNDEILIFDISKDKPTGYAKRASDLFDGERVFSCSKDNLLRVQQGFLYRGSNSIMTGQLGEKQIIPVTQNQTWITSSEHNSLTFGIQRFFNVYEFFLYNFNKKEVGERFVLPIANFDKNESLLDISVEFEPHSLICLMKTEIKGKKYIRVSIIDSHGTILSQYKIDAVSSDTHRKIFGKAYAKPSGTLGIILHPTDDGVVQQIIEKDSIGKLSLLSETEQFVSESDELYFYVSGILVFGDNLINYLTIS